MPALGFPDKAAGQNARFEIERPHVLGNIRYGGVQLFAVRLYLGFQPIHGIDHEMSALDDPLVMNGGVLQSIFVNPVEIGAFQGGRGNAFLGESPHSHILVAERKNGFRHLIVRGVKSPLRHGKRSVQKYLSAILAIIFSLNLLFSSALCRWSFSLSPKSSVFPKHNLVGNRIFFPSRFSKNALFVFFLLLKLSAVPISPSFSLFPRPKP